MNVKNSPSNNFILPHTSCLLFSHEWSRRVAIINVEGGPWEVPVRFFFNVLQIKTFLNNYFQEKKKSLKKHLIQLNGDDKGEEKKFFLETMKIAWAYRWCKLGKSCKRRKSFCATTFVKWQFSIYIVGNISSSVEVRYNWMDECDKNFLRLFPRLAHKKKQDLCRVCTHIYTRTSS